MQTLFYKNGIFVDLYTIIVNYTTYWVDIMFWISAIHKRSPQINLQAILEESIK